MLKRDVTKLAVYQGWDKEKIPFECLADLYLKKTSEIIYITNKGKLFGIVSMREALNPDENGEVTVNRTFTKQIGYNVIEAHEIFHKKSRIHKIPVVDDTDELLGDYSRWNDLLYIKRTHKMLMQRNMVQKILKSYETVYVIEPVEDKKDEYMWLIGSLHEYEITHEVLRKEDVGSKLTESSICIFVDEDERRGVQCYHKIKPLLRDSQGYDIVQCDKLVESKYKLRLATYKSLLLQIMHESQMERIKIRKSEKTPFYRLDEKASVLLSALQEKGLACLCLCCDSMELTAYGKKIRHEIAERVKTYALHERMWVEKEPREEFYGQLFQSDDYAKETVHKELCAGDLTFEYKDVTGKYFNARDGKRHTCCQPEAYKGTIYMLGPCVMVGALVEDQYTIESFLQKKLLEKGLAYRVENYGAMVRFDAEIDSRLEGIHSYKKNDIIIYLSRIGEAAGIQGESLERIFERHSVPVQWIIDGYTHCNHQANQVIAESILEMIGPFLAV